MDSIAHISSSFLEIKSERKYNKCACSMCEQLRSRTADRSNASARHSTEPGCSQGLVLAKTRHCGKCLFSNPLVTLIHYSYIFQNYNPQRWAANLPPPLQSGLARAKDQRLIGITCEEVNIPLRVLLPSLWLNSPLSVTSRELILFQTALSRVRLVRQCSACWPVIPQR